MCSLSYNSINNFFEIEVIQPKFDDIYKKYQQKVNKAHIMNDVIEAIKELIANDGDLTYGRNFSVEYIIAKPLKEKGYSKTGDAIRYLIDKEYFKESSNMGNIEFTLAGWNWIHDESGNTVKEGKNDSVVYSEYSFFETPDNSSDKIKELLKEINQLPKSNIDNYPNLITHQLRTILALVIIEYWEKVNNKKLPPNKKGSLKKLIQHTIDSAKSNKLSQAKSVVTELNNLKANKTKELADDVVHCNYSIVNGDIVDKFCKNIKHLLSLIYGR